MAAAIAEKSCIESPYRLVHHYPPLSHLLNLIPPRHYATFFRQVSRQTCALLILGEEPMMNKTMSRRLGLAAIVVASLVLVVANPFGVRLWHPPTAAADPLTPFGVSGGNVKDISALFCCSGTLGSLVTAQTTDGIGFFILSNNHVLARSNAASIGEAISQPGLIDFQCRVPPTVANLTAFPQLTSNVDAAIARLTTTSSMDTSGKITGIGTISSNPSFASAGLPIQ